MSDKEPITLVWTDPVSMKDYRELDFPESPGVYLFLYSVNNFHRITYIGETDSIRRRINEYFRDYKKPNEKGHSLDLSLVENDICKILGTVSGNSIQKLHQGHIYYPSDSFGVKINDDIYWEIRKKFFEESFFSYCCCGLEDESVRLKVQRNLQMYFVRYFDSMDYGGGNYFIGACSSEKGYFDKELVIHNRYNDSRLQMLPFTVRYDWE